MQTQEIWTTASAKDFPACWTPDPLQLPQCQQCADITPWCWRSRSLLQCGRKTKWEVCWPVGAHGGGLQLWMVKLHSSQSGQIKGEYWTLGRVDWLGVSRCSESLCAPCACGKSEQLSNRNEVERAKRGALWVCAGSTDRTSSLLYGRLKGPATAVSWG